MTPTVAGRVGAMMTAVGVLGTVALMLGIVVGSGGLAAIGLAGAVAYGLWAAFQKRAAVRHRREIATFALTHGWEYEPSTTVYSGRFNGLPFDVGTRRRQEDVLRGSFAGARCATFTHVYESDRSRRLRARSSWLVLGDVPGGSELLWSSVGSAKVESFQVTLVELPVDLPRIDLVPERIASRAMRVFGASDVDVESHAFNTRWRVIASDARYAHALLDPRMIDRLVQPDVEGMALRIDGGALMMWSPGRLGPDDLARRLSVLTSVARRIPAHVVREHMEAGFGRGADRPIPPTAPDWAITPGALTSHRWTGIEPGPAATGEGWSGLPSGDEDFDIFRIGWHR